MGKKIVVASIDDDRQGEGGKFRSISAALPMPQSLSPVGTPIPRRCGRDALAGARDDRAYARLVAKYRRNRRFSQSLRPILAETEEEA